MQHGWGVSSVPISLISDSYKASHYLQYPDCQKMVAVSSETSWFELLLILQMSALPPLRMSRPAAAVVAVWRVPCGV